MPEEAEAGTLSNQDEVGGAVGQVSRRRETFRAARTGATHAGCIYRQELPSDRPPLTVVL